MPTPTCVQHVQGFSNENFETGNDFRIEIEPTLANNCLVLCCSYAYSASRTIAFKDQSGTTLSFTQAQKTDDTTNNVTTAIYVLPNAAAGITAIVTTFDAAINGFYPDFSEWYNVATSSPLDGTGAAANLVTGGTIASGSFTTSTNGDLIIHHGVAAGWGISYEGGYNDGVTSKTKQSGYTLLACDFMGMLWTQYQVQSTAGATNPAMTWSGGSVSPDQFNSVTIALKAASAGTAPNPSDLRVFGKYHCRLRAPSTGNYTLFTPLTGSLAVIATAYGTTFVSIDSISGSVSGSWTKVPTGTNAFPQIYYQQPLTASDSDVLTVHITPAGSTEYQFVLYDIINGGAYSSFATANSGAFGPGTVSNMPSITPAISSGIAIGAIGFGTGPPNALSSPSGAKFDSGFYTGYTDLSPWDSGDGYGHYVFSSNATQAWNWNDTSATGSANATVAIFAQAVLAPTINANPTAQSQKANTQGTFTVSATASAGGLSYQWKIDRGSGYVNIGPNSATWTTQSLQLTDAGNVKCTVSDSNGSTDTTPVALGVYDPAANDPVVFTPRRRRLPGGLAMGVDVREWF